LGIAESAHARSIDSLVRRCDSVPDDPHAMMNLADNIVDLNAMRASLDLSGRRIDDYFAAFPCGDATVTEAQAITADVQAAKAFICAGAQRVTDRALALSGGAGYMAAHPLAKAWRDARAGAFMHPFGANRAFDLVARTALGLALGPEPGADRSRIDR
jgi:alkylation response protein AidB-like acyl-CoA dehydrogenase